MPVSLRTGSASHARRILCYGDSLTVGFCSGGTRFEPYARSLLREIGNSGASCEVAICGHSGMTARDMVEAAGSSLRDVAGLEGKGLLRILQENGPFDLVLIMAGTNDMGHNIRQEDILQSLRSLHEVCHDRGVPTVSLAPPPAPHAGAVREMHRQRFTGLLQRMARSNDRIVACIDPADYLPSSETKFSDPDGFYDPDGLHFSPAGSRHLGKCLASLAMEHLFAEPALEPRARRRRQDTAQKYATSVRVPSAPRPMSAVHPEWPAALPTLLHTFCTYPVPVYA